MAMHVAPSFEALEKLSQTRDADLISRKMVDARTNRGRGAQTNRGSRFDTQSREEFDDGWGQVEELKPFETIEHIEPQKAFLDELARVVKPEGIVILSCPNRLEYRDKRGFENPFHVRELYREELAALVTRHFPAVAWYGQRPTFFSVIAPEGGASAAQAQVVEVSEADPASATATLSDPLYFVLVASRHEASLMPVAPALSVLADRGDWVHRDYEKVMRELEITVRRGEALEKRVAELERRLAEKGK